MLDSCSACAICLLCPPHPHGPVSVCLPASSSIGTTRECVSVTSQRRVRIGGQMSKGGQGRAGHSALCLFLFSRLLCFGAPGQNMFWHGAIAFLFSPVQYRRFLRTCFPSLPISGDQPNQVLSVFSVRRCYWRVLFMASCCCRVKPKPQVASGTVAAGADGKAHDGSDASQCQVGEGAQGVPRQGRPASPPPVSLVVRSFVFLPRVL